MVEKNQIIFLALQTLNTMSVKSMKWILNIRCSDGFCGQTRKLKEENTESTFVFMWNIFFKFLCSCCVYAKNCCRHKSLVGRPATMENGFLIRYPPVELKFTGG